MEGWPYTASCLAWLGEIGPGKCDLYCDAWTVRTACLAGPCCLPSVLARSAQLHFQLLLHGTYRQGPALYVNRSLVVTNEDKYVHSDILGAWRCPINRGGGGV
jgi:hypothetical protein